MTSTPCARKIASGCDRATGGQPRTADRHHETIERRLIFQHLQRDSTLPRNDGRIVIGMHEDKVLARRQLVRESRGLRQGFAFKQHARGMMPGPRHLHKRRRFRHHNRRGDSKEMRVIGDALRVVAGGHRDNTALRFLRRQRQQLVGRATLLERRGELLVLQLEPDLGTRDVRQRARLDQRRANDAASNAARSRPQVRVDDPGEIASPFVAHAVLPCR